MLEFGAFQTKTLLARGGMAEIYLAEHVASKQKVVLKRLLPKFLSEPEIIDLFLTEADVGRLLRHPNIVQVLDAGEESGQYYIAMEYIDGLPLEALKTEAENQKLRIPPHLVCRIAVDALRGLYSAHILTSQQGTPFGLVHRDISPGNVLISRQGVTKIADFGVANLESHGSANTQRYMHGKPHYMSPEHARQMNLDGRSDIYSLALILYELLSGTHVFKPKRGESEQEQVTRILERKLQPLGKLSPDIPRPITKVLRKALQKTRWRRFSTAKAFADALEEVASGSKLWASEQDVSDYVCRSFQ